MKKIDAIETLRSHLGATELAVRTPDGRAHMSIEELCSLAAIGLRTFEDALKAPSLTAVPVYAVANPEMLEISRKLRTQDNRMTSHPMYAVRQKREFTTSDSIWCDADSGNPVTAELEEQLDAIWDDYEDTSVTLNGKDYVRKYATHSYFEWVTVFFTNDAAEAYIRANAHNLNDPHVYVASGWRNPEWQAMRAFLLGLTPPTDASRSQEI